MGYDYSTIDCDLRTELESFGYTQTVAIIVLVVQSVALVINILVYVGLRTSQPCLIFLCVLIMWVGIILQCVNFVLTKQYYYILILVFPLILACFFTWIYNQARYHAKKA